MRLIDADTLVEAILDARRSKTDTVPKLIAFINNQPTEAWKGLTPTADVMEALEDLARNGSQSRFCKYEQKRGRWEVTKYLNIEGYFYKCSECRSEFDCLCDYLDDWQFCPICGARMENEE